MVTDLSYYLWRCPERISDLFEDYSAAPGDYLQKFGEPVEYVYLLLEGEAKGYLHCSDGTRKEVMTHHSNQLSGYLSYFSGAKLDLDVRAVFPCKLKRIHGDVFLQWMSVDHLFMQYVNATICKRYIDIKRSLEKEPGMYRNFCTKCFLFQKIVEGERIFSKRELALAIDVDYDTADRIVGDLSTEGLVEKHRCEVTIVDARRVKSQALRLHKRMIHREEMGIIA